MIDNTRSTWKLGYSPQTSFSFWFYATMAALNASVCVVLLRRISISPCIEGGSYHGIYDLGRNQTIHRLCGQIILQNTMGGHDTPASNIRNVYQRCADFLNLHLGEKLRFEIALEEHWVQNSKARELQTWKDRTIHPQEWNFYFKEDDPLRPERELWSTTTFPDINIIGFPKAGTSQLYAVLTSHEDTKRFDRGKEFCMLSADSALLNSDKHADLLKKLHEWHINLHRQQSARPFRQEKKQIKTVNACLVDRDVLLRYEYLGRPESKFIFLFRDPADWLWAIWNFWIDASVDSFPPKRLDWATSERHYRSPELFHEWIVSGNRTRTGLKLLEFRDRTVDVPLRYLQAAGPDRVLFLRSEDMLPETVDQPGGFLDKLAQFTALDRSKFQNSTLQSKHNCNQVKGPSKSCNALRATSSYAIAGNRPMLPETRTLIYLEFYEECKVWRQHFGILYQNCLSVLD